MCAHCLTTLHALLSIQNMADPKDIPQPVSDRTLVHGRNVMAIAGVLIVLAYVPGIEIEKFKPFGFQFDTDSLLSAWGLLAVVLFYYTTRFIVDCSVEWLPWRGTYIEDSSGVFAPRKLENVLDKSLNDPKFYKNIIRLQNRFVFWDFAPPMVMALLGFVAASIKIYGLVFK